jgi:hypothetical protein
MNILSKIYDEQDALIKRWWSARQTIINYHALKNGRHPNQWERAMIGAILLNESIEYAESLANSLREKYVSYKKEKL